MLSRAAIVFVKADSAAIAVKTSNAVLKGHSASLTAFMSSTVRALLPKDVTFLAIELAFVAGIT